ncbi:hypothetical protein L9F63_018899, partial [Diploptera punctata]
WKNLDLKDGTIYGVSQIIIRRVILENSRKTMAAVMVPDDYDDDTVCVLNDIKSKLNLYGCNIQITFGEQTLNLYLLKRKENDIQNSVQRDNVVVKLDSIYYDSLTCPFFNSHLNTI